MDWASLDSLGCKAAAAVTAVTALAAAVNSSTLLAAWTFVLGRSSPPAAAFATHSRAVSTQNALCCQNLAPSLLQHAHVVVAVSPENAASLRWFAAGRAKDHGLTRWPREETRLHVQGCQARVAPSSTTATGDS
jgi:hypothetical protein